MTDKKFREWIQRQPSCLTGGFSEYIHGEGRNLACHVRRANASGTGYKPEFSCVPMTNTEHLVQHSQGESACLRCFLGGRWTVEEAKAWFEEQAAKFREQWGREQG